MEDCKCERRLSDPLDPPSEETVKKAVDMLESYQKEFRELNRKSKLPIEVTEEHIKIINRFMEEKKTKKMTKVEAFEWLKGKKVKCICAVAHEDAQANKVERFLKDVGCKYHFANHISWRDWYWPLYGFIVDKKGEIYVAFENQMDFFVQDLNEEISADDILSIEIVEEEEDTSMPTVELERYVKILQVWSKRLNSSFVFSERGMGIVRGDLLTKLEGEEKGAYYKREATL